MLQAVVWGQRSAKKCDILFEWPLKHKRRKKYVTSYARTSENDFALFSLRILEKKNFCVFTKTFCLFA